MGKLAITGGKPVRRKPFPAWPVYSNQESRALLQVLRSRNWGGYPFPNVHASAFAAKFAKTHGAKYGIALANGTVAIEVALKAVGIKPGDEVIVPAYTWEGTVGPILLLNAVPVFVDVDPNTYCLDARFIEQAITPKTRAILPVHLAMSFADLDEILRIARPRNIAVMEDCAHAHGGQWRGKGAGASGDFGCFSFQSSKIMTAGEGGAVITSNLEYFERAQSYVNCGRASVTDQFRRRLIGFNYRMTEFQAAILEVQLERMPKQAKARLANMDHFERRLRGVPGLAFLKRDKRITRVAAYQFVFKYLRENFGGIPRAAFLGALEMEGIPCDGLFYEPVYRSALFPVDPADFPALSWNRTTPLNLKTLYQCPVSERAAYEEAVWLPHHIFLGARKDTDDIAEAVLKVCENINELRNLKHPAVDRKSMSRAERPRVEKRQW
ncbi:MAG TPA: DegT/DnrJ/EryC1/StrS family aminotransferase [Candidatus Bathyarchaeia archaeon]|jgi:dTDP-4-amino-4,6-dideoxygalactose transaminase|nr:DegT/DnrJ/EryC1/StrS family aminotransferase [Candidatus Bathyarchaeia archaeon]